MENTMNLQQEKKNNNSFSFSDYFIVIFVLLLIIIIGYSLISLFTPNKNLTDKSQLQNEINTLICNSADLDVVKAAFENRKNISISMFKFWNYYSIDENKYYRTNEITLSKVLNDIHISYYNSVYVFDTVKIKKLENLIKINNERDPFEKLLDNQRYLFENLRSKLSENYFFVKEDINKIADDVDENNKLVNKYLSRSEISFWISIFAVIITVVISAYQIMSSNKYKKKLFKCIDAKEPFNDKMVADNKNDESDVTLRQT